MNFTEEQQGHVDKLISKKYAEAMSKAEAKASEQLAEAAAKHAEEIQTLKAELEKLHASQGESNERIRKALLKAEIAQSSAIKPDQVQKLLDESFSLGEDGELKVVDERGVVRLDEAGRPLSVKTHLEGFLKENPHLAKSTPLRGAGSSSLRGIFGNGDGGRTIRRAEFDSWDSARKNNHIQSGGSITD